VDKFCSDVGIRDDTKMVLVVGRMDPIKRQDIVIKAIPHLTSEFPDFEVVFVGNGSFTSSAEGGLSHPKANVWHRQLQKLARELGVEKHVRFTGYLPDELLRAAYRRADVLVLPSRREGFGLVVAGAQLYKKPVVVSRGAGISEMIIEGTNGYTFEPQDVKGLVEKLRLVLKNSELAARMGRGEAKPQRSFSWMRASKNFDYFHRDHREIQEEIADRAGNHFFM